VYAPSTTTTTANKRARLRAFVYIRVSQEQLKTNIKLWPNTEKTSTILSNFWLIKNEHILDLSI
jgi:hypothetical protein